MKTLLGIFLILSFSQQSFAGELDSIALLTPISYEQKTSATQTFTSKVKVGIGDLIKTDVTAEVKKKVEPYRQDLAAYFSKPGELDTFVSKVASEGKNATVGNDLTDAKLIKFYEYLGNNLIGGFADKILKTEGVTDPARRLLWVNKMLAPFDHCISIAQNSQYDASRCLDALTSSLVPSAGVGIVYELSRSNLDASLSAAERPSFKKEQTDLYKECMRKASGEASDVKKCAIVAMRAGVLKVSSKALAKTVTESTSSPAVAQKIKTAVLPGLNTCVQNVGADTASSTPLNKQFMNCIDGLVKSTGALVVQDKLANTPAVKTNFSKVEITKLIADKVQSFSDCVAEQKQNDIRKDGMLDTSKCENSITNDVTYKVVVKTLAQTAKESFPKDEKNISDVSNEGKRLLDLCWNNDQNGKEREACLRKTILSFSQSLGAIKLDKAIPDDLKDKSDLVKTSIKDLTSCLEKELPANISEATNLSASTSLCSNKLTKSVALEVARETIRLKALENKLTPEATEEMVRSYVDQKFMTCLGTSPSDAKLDSCSGDLKKNASLVLAASQIRVNAAGKVTPAATDALIDNLVNKKFKDCLGANPSDKVLDSCIGDLTKAATKSIVLSYEKSQIKDQLNADFTPDSIKPVEDAFTACVDKSYGPKEVSKALDECTKQFALGFAKTLGELKITTLMKSVLGLKNYNDQQKSIDDMLAKYNACLDDLKQYGLEDGLLDKLSTCTSSLERRGINFVSNTVNTWMSSEEKDAATAMVKQEFAHFLPCMSALLPASPYDPKMEQNIDSVLKPVAMLLSQYIEYSPENAKRSLDEIIKKLSTDLKDVATNPASKKELIDLLYKNGALDQFIKSMVRGQVKDALEQTSEADLPKDLRDILMKKENFDKIFATPEGLAIKDMVMEKILKPVLMEQASMSSPLMTAGTELVKDKVIKLLVNAPTFGEQIIKSGIQKKINETDMFTKFFAKILYGNKSLNWGEVGKTSEGVAAENYIKENYVLPLFKGQKFTKDEEKKIMAEAERLVKSAVKNYE